MRKLAMRLGYVAVPKETRWHKKNTALLGGVAIYLATAVTLLGFAFYRGWDFLGQTFLVLMGAVSAIFLLGLLDDLFNMAPQHKLAGQIVVSGVLVFLGYHFEWTGLETLDILISLFWLVGITNAFNLLDNMDGLCAGVGFIAAGFLLAFNWLYPQQMGFPATSEIIIAAFIGALLGFLVYNFNPASIFMGDAGSLFIGFLLASLTMQAGAEKSASPGFLHILSVIAVPIFIVLIPIVDTTLVTVTRKLFGRRVSQGGRDHSSHRLVAIGFSEKRAVLVLYGFSLASGCLALVIQKLPWTVALLVVVIYLLFILFFWIYLGKVKVYEEDSIIGREKRHGITPVLVEVTYRRRLLEVLLDVVLISLAYYVAYLLRFEGHIGKDFAVFLKSLPVIIAMQILSNYVFGVYRGVWSSTSLEDIQVYAKAVTAGTVLSVLILLGLYRFAGFSRAVFAIYWIFVLAFMSLARLSFRLLDEGVLRRTQNGREALIYGAGLGGQMALREIEWNKALGLKAVGFIDDNSTLHGRRIRGYPVLGGKEDLLRIVDKYGIEEVIVSFRENGERTKEEIQKELERVGKDVKVRQMKLTIQ